MGGWRISLDCHGSRYLFGLDSFRLFPQVLEIWGKMRARESKIEQHTEATHVTSVGGNNAQGLIARILPVCYAIVCVHGCT